MSSIIKKTEEQLQNAITAALTAAINAGELPAGELPSKCRQTAPMAIWPPT